MEPDPKTALFTFLGYLTTILRTAYRKQFYPKPVVLLESRDSFASLESVTRHLADGPLKVAAKSGHVTVTKIENLRIDTRRKNH